MPPLSILFITLHSLKIMESLDNRFTSQVDFNNEYSNLVILKRGGGELKLRLLIFIEEGPFRTEAIL